MLALLLIGKSSPCGGSGFPLSLFAWFTICPTPYNRRYNVLSALLNKTLPSFLQPGTSSPGTSVLSSAKKEGNVLFNDAFNTFYLRLYGRKEGNVLFNDAFNTFYLRLYGRKEGNVLFNDALNTFYLRLYGVRHMVKDHS